MTDSERHAIIGKLVEDRCNARRTLAFLEAKKGQIIRSMDRMKREYLVPEVGHPGPEFSISYPTEGEIFSLIEDLRDSREELSELEKSCRDLGLE